MDICSYIKMGSDTHFMIFIMSRYQNKFDFKILPNGSLVFDPPLILNSRRLARSSTPFELMKGLGIHQWEEWEEKFKDHLSEIDSLILNKRSIT